MNADRVAVALEGYLRAQVADPRPFSWRNRNCIHFAGGFVALVEGDDPVQGLPMRAGRAASWRELKARGGFAAAVSGRLGREPMAPLLAQVGDLVLLRLSPNDREAQALGLCCGETAVCMGSLGELLHLPMTQAEHAWRICPC